MHCFSAKKHLIKQMHVILACIDRVVTDVPRQLLESFLSEILFGIFVSGVFLTARTVVRSVFKNTKMSNIHICLHFSFDLPGKRRSLRRAIRIWMSLPPSLDPLLVLLGRQVEERPRGRTSRRNTTRRKQKPRLHF